MNAYLSKKVRKKYRATWQEEYIVGMIAYLGPLNTKRILYESETDVVMSPATAHKYLKSAISKKLLTIHRSKEDGRAVVIDISENGMNFLNDIKCSQLKS